jgi:hypothetical protein
MRPHPGEVKLFHDNQIFPSSDDNDDNFSETPHRTKMETMVNHGTWLLA